MSFYPAGQLQDENQADIQMIVR